MNPPAAKPRLNLPNRLRLFLSRWKLVLSVVGLGIGVGWLADALNDGPLFKSWLWAACRFEPFCLPGVFAQTAISGLIALALVAVSAYHLYTEYSQGKVVQLQEQALRPHKVLIMWLSTGPEGENIETGDDQTWVSWGNAPSAGPATRFQLGTDLETDAQSPGQPKWNMWQLLRAARPHAPKLEMLTLLVTPGSESRAAFASAMLQHYFKLSPSVLQTPVKVDEHHIQGQIDAVNRLIAQAKENGHSESDILIDCTGGLKLSSIAAACATLNNPIALQYVNTDPADPSVKTYQLVYMAPQS